MDSFGPEFRRFKPYGTFLRKVEKKKSVSVILKTTFVMNNVRLFIIE